jgi:hypothetical protein
MATWKKLIVSGSNISQLANDAGYLTTTPPSSNAFATASYNGTNLLADGTGGTLTFASGSGGGLLISASAGNDTLTFSLVAIPNGSLANSAMTIAGTSVSLGGSITQATILAGSNVWSGSAQLPSGVVSGSSQITYSGISGIPSGIISGSGQIVLSSPAQGEARLTISGVAQTAVDLGLQTTDSPTFAGLNITGNLIVQGTASFQSTTNLDVADRFIRLASGSAAGGDGGIVVQQTGATVGEAFAFDFATLRWGVTSSFNAQTNTIVPDAFAGMVLVGAGTVPTAVDVRYQAKGNTFIGTDEAIWIYS